MIPEIYENIHESIFELVKQMEILSLEYDNLTSVNSAEHISSCGCNCPTNIDEVSLYDTPGEKSFRIRIKMNVCIKASYV